MKISKRYSALLLTCIAGGALMSMAQAITPTISADKIVMPKSTEDNELATFRATQRYQHKHYRKIILDDAFSMKILHRYLDELDPRHNTFLQTDITQIEQEYGHSFDDQLKAGFTKAAFAIYQLYAKRRYERYAYALSLLDKPLDLTGNDTIEKDRTKATWPANQAAADALWLARVKNDEISQKLKGKTWAEIKKKLAKRYNLAIRYLTQTNADDITQLYLNAFAQEIDPHTSYFSPRSLKRFRESLALSLEGIGATLQMDDDTLVIKSLIKGAPAERSKQLKEGDKIIGVGQSRNKIEDIVGWRMDDAIDKIKGKKGTKVYLEIEPEKGGKSRIVTLVRDKIRLEDQEAKLTFSTVNGEKIGVIEIPSFYTGISKTVRKFLNEAKAKKINALVIDLRNNGGGLLEEVIELSGLFITDGPIVQVRDAYNRVRERDDPDHRIVYAGPLVIMINRYSASASEIFAAAMQDYHRALILGQNSYGKGTVQQNAPLNSITDAKPKELGGAKYTIQKFYRINGGSTQLKGVQPNIEFPATINAKENGEETEDNALPWDKISPVFYVPNAPLTPYVAPLTEKHNARMAKNFEFIYLNKKLAEEKREDEEKTISLNFAKRKAEYDKDDAAYLAHLNERFKRAGKPRLKKLDDLPKDYEAPDYYLKEAEFIAADYAKMLQQQPQNKDDQMPEQHINVELVPVTAFQQNCSLIWDEEKNAAIIDPGGDAEKIMQRVAELGLNVQAILLTHGHLDHVGAAQTLKAHYNVPVLGAAQGDKFWFENVPTQAQQFRLPTVETFTPDRWLDTDGEVLSIGNIRLEVMHLPGHTPGHIGFIDREHNVAFTGDVLFQGSIGRTDFPQGDHATLLHSIREKLYPLGDDMIIIAGHGQPTTIGKEKQHNPFL